MRKPFIAVLCLLLSGVASAQSRSPKKGKLNEEPAAAPAPAPVVEPPPPAPTPVVEPAPPAKVTVAVPADQKPRLAVVRLEPQGVSAEEASAMTDAVVAALSARGLFNVISSKDVETAIGAERQRQLLGVCEAQPDACGTAIGEGLSAPFVLSGQLSRIGSTYQLTLQTVDTTKGRSIGRSNRLSSSLDELQRIVPYAAAEATGVPLPPPPSRVVPIALLIAGGASFIAGSIAGIITLTQQQQLNDELCPGGVPSNGRCMGEGLRERDFYLAQDEVLRGQKWLAAGLLAGGVVLTVLGLVVMPPAESTGRLSAMLVPTLNGFALTGGFW